MISYTREWHQLIKYDPNVTPNQTNGILIMSLWFWNWEIYSLDGYIGVADISEVTEIIRFKKLAWKQTINAHAHAQQATVWKSLTFIYHPLVQFPAYTN